MTEEIKQTINQLPKDWKQIKMGDIFTIERGGSPRPIEEFITNDTNGINWIKIGDTKNVIKYIYKTKEKIKPEGVKRSRMVYEDDFILSNSMSFGKPYIMKTAGCIHDGWLVIRKNENIDNNFLYYILGSPVVYQQFARLAKGSTVKNLNIEAVKQVELSVPPKATQQAIVSKIEELFSELDKGIENLHIAQQQLKTYRQSVLKWAFEGKLTEVWRNTKQNNIDRKFWTVVNTNKYKIGFEICIPNEWIVLPVGNICDFQQGMQIAKKTRLRTREDGSLPILRIKNYRDGFKTDVEYIKVDEASLIAEKEDIILTRTGESRGDILTGFKGIFHNNTFRINFPKPQLNREFLIYYLSTSKVQNYIKNNSSRTGQPDLTHRNFGPCPVPIPSTKEQEQIVQEIESRLSVVDKMVQSITQSLQQSEALRQSILKKAFEGKLV